VRAACLPLRDVTGDGALGEAEHPGAFPPRPTFDDISVKPTQPGRKGRREHDKYQSNEGWMVVLTWLEDGCVGVEHTRTASSHLGREGEEKTKKKGFRRHPRFLLQRSSSG